MGVTIWKEDIKDLGSLVCITAGPAKYTRSPRVATLSELFTSGLLLYLREAFKGLWVTICRKGKGRPGLHEFPMYWVKLTIGKKKSISYSASSEKQSAEWIQCSHLSILKIVLSIRTRTMNGNMRQGPTKRYGKTAICHRRQISIKMIMLKYRISQCGNFIIISTSIQNLLWFRCYARQYRELLIWLLSDLMEVKN